MSLDVNRTSLGPTAKEPGKLGGLMYIDNLKSNIASTFVCLWGLQEFPVSIVLC